MHSHEAALRRNIKSIEDDLLERYKAWIEVGLADMQDNTELCQLSIDAFRLDLQQLLHLAKTLGKLEQAHERTEEK